MHRFLSFGLIALIAVPAIAELQIRQFELASVLETRISRDIERVIDADAFILDIDIELTSHSENASHNPAPVAQTQSMSQPPIAPLVQPKLPGLSQTQPDIEPIQPPVEENPQVAAVPPVSGETVRNIQTLLVIDHSINGEDVATIRGLVAKKLNYDPLRGDEIRVQRAELIRAQAPDATTEPLVDSDSETTQQWWILAAIGGALVLLLLIWLLTRNKRACQPVYQEEAPTSPQQLLNTKKAELKSIRQDLIAYSLAEPSKVTAIMERLSLNEQNLPMLAACYQELGRSLFTSMYPSLESRIPAYLRYLEEHPADYDTLVTQMSDLHQLLKNSNEDQRAQGQSRPFAFLERMDTNQVHWVLNDQPTRIKAIVLSQLNAKVSSDLLALLDEQERTQVAIEIAQLDTIPLATYREVAAQLAERAQWAPKVENVVTDGNDLLIKLLDSMTIKQQSALLNKVKLESPNAYLSLRKKYYAFEDILRTPQDVLSNVLRSLELTVLAGAIADLDQAKSDYILAGFPDRLKMAVSQEIESAQTLSPDVRNDYKAQVVQRLRAAMDDNLFSMGDLAA
ncbi:FliG C-terminal domain-containing protein [Vibrio agarivorans]|uniref:FliG C-terminal domain-containing protein n=1 Tax=Vibrio agarivorans TaxID=153622 RepID=UPI0025B4E053|nr:FliG C-terminal domain-containing protein [Vibrio agarivorans]MDN3662738.1 FliG C-terminal domain-containing protein [Vibrio agarivorans]